MKVGFIGAGNMGCAIMRGAFQGGFLKPYETMVYDVSEQQLAALTASYPVNAPRAGGNPEILLQQEDYLHCSRVVHGHAHRDPRT